jgi:hypothetical protein
MTLVDLKDYQGITTGLLAFAGAMIALGYNGWREREQRNRERAYEAAVLRRALLAELTHLKEEFERALSTVEGAEADGIVDAIASPGTKGLDIYLSCIPRIGLLTVNEVAPVVRAYESIRGSNEVLMNLAQGEKDPAGHWEVSVTEFPALKDGFRRVIAATELARLELINEIAPG